MIFKDLQFDLDLWPCDLKINRDHLLLRSIHYTKFGDFQGKGSNDIEQTMIFKDQQFDLDLRPHDIKIIRGHLLHRVIDCTMFGNCLMPPCVSSRSNVWAVKHTMSWKTSISITSGVKQQKIINLLVRRFEVRGPYPILSRVRVCV